MELKLEEVIYFILDQTHRKVKLYSQQRFDAMKMNITVEQWVLLKIIEENTEISQVDLARLAVKDTASITRMLDKLEKNELILRKNDSGDRRKHTLVLTSGGRNFIRKYMPLVTELRKQGVKGLTEKELHQLQSTLKKIAENMS